MDEGVRDPSSAQPTGAGRAASRERDFRADLAAPTPGFAAIRTPGAFLYIHAGVRSRSDCRSVAELVADGWTVEHINQWGGALCRKKLK